jgi:Arc/MetJ-type ribon-helix-helix transcriptional regulator
MSEEKKHSTTRETLREQIMGKSAETDFDTSKREVHVMTRLSKQIVEAVDALVTLNVFNSRSEAVAAYVENAIISDVELYESLIKKAKEVSKMRDTAMDSILETLQKGK